MKEIYGNPRRSKNSNAFFSCHKTVPCQSEAGTFFHHIIMDQWSAHTTKTLLED